MLSSKSARSCLPLCDPVDGSPPFSSVHGISRVRVAISSLGNLPDPGIEPASLESLALADGVFTTELTGKQLSRGELQWENECLGIV